VGVRPWAKTVARGVTAGNHRGAGQWLRLWAQKLLTAEYAENGREERREEQEQS